MPKCELVEVIIRIRSLLNKEYVPAWKFMRLRKSELLSQLSFYFDLYTHGGSYVTN